MRMIIPCAGFGTRMGMEANKSKEMLYDPMIRGPVIDYSLSLAAKYGLSPLIITRSEKTDLIAYAKGRSEVLIIEPQNEWPDTILASNTRWHVHNLLVLPDTRFTSTDVIQNMRRDLINGAALSIALHKVKDSRLWCMVDDYRIVEKPKREFSGDAMGLIAFSQYYGEKVFEHLKKRGKYFDLEYTSFQYLDRFVDITRTGQIQEY